MQQTRRRPIFPKGCPLSIFGAGELNFRVRDGNGCGLSARVTRILYVGRFGKGAIRVTFRRAGLPEELRYSSRRAVTARIIAMPAADAWSVAEEVKPSTISTASLNASLRLHVRPIKQLVSLRSYPVTRWGTSS